MDRSNCSSTGPGPQPTSPPPKNLPPLPSFDRVFGPYFDGKAEVYADPFEAYRLVWQYLDGEPNEWIDKRSSPDPETSSRATEKIVQATRYAFGVEPFDPVTGGGLLEDDLIDLLDRFILYCVKKKQTPSSLATSSGPTGPTSSASGPTLRPPSACS